MTFEHVLVAIYIINIPIIYIWSRKEEWSIPLTIVIWAVSPFSLFTGLYNMITYVGILITLVLMPLFSIILAHEFIELWFDVNLWDYFFQ
tara:strand:+ start:2059 stop:2328 length:270 start_codon:yes stop_codon:yes gene_type:complete